MCIANIAIASDFVSNNALCIRTFCILCLPFPSPICNELCIVLLFRSLLKNLKYPLHYFSVNLQWVVVTYLQLVNSERIKKIKLRVKCIFRRTDADATQNTEDIILISSYRCDWNQSSQNLPFSSNPNLAHTYTVSNDRICVSYLGANQFQITSVYGEDYFVSGLSDKNNPGHSVFPLGNSAYPYNDLLTGSIILEANSKRSSRNKTTIDNAELNVPGSQLAEITAENEIVISGNSVIHQDIHFYLDSPFGCMDNNILPTSMDHSYVINNICNTTTTYDPNLERSYAQNTNNRIGLSL